MDLTNKKYLEISSGNIISVKDHFEDIVILENGQKIRLGKLLDKNYYDEYIDPASFFSSKAYDDLAEKIKSIPDAELEKINDNESAIIYVDAKDEMAELEAKAAEISNKNINDSKRQLEHFKSLLSESDNIDIPINQQENNPNDPFWGISSPTEQLHFRPNLNMEQPSIRKSEDPIYTMFRNTKRNIDFLFQFDVEEKIPRLDFIEMMEDSYQTSIIDFLADEFTQKLLKNPNLIKEKISEKIRNLVFNRDSKSKKINKKMEKEKFNNPEENKIEEDLIQDGVSTIPENMKKINDISEKPLNSTPPTPPKDRILKEGQTPTPPKE